jgi:hypothetical protein
MIKGCYTPFMDSGHIERMDKLVMFYLGIGLEVIPLKPDTKTPSQPGYLNTPVEKLWKKHKGQYNIGLRLGKIVDLENDDENYGTLLDDTLEQLGVRNYPKYRSKRGMHRLVQLDYRPRDLKNKNWIKPNETDSDVHYGELRVSGQSVMPESVVEGFQYLWIDGSDKYLESIPHVNWHKIKHLTKHDEYQSKISYKPEVFEKSKTNVEIWLSDSMRKLNRSVKGSPVTLSNKRYPSRSEAVAAIVAFLISNGYDLGKVTKAFEEYKPGHYMEKGDKRQYSLQSLYSKIYNSKYRQSILKEMAQLSTSYLKDKVYHVLLSLAFQFNTDKVYRTLSLLASDVGIANPNSKNGPRKACLKLEEEGKIKINVGKRYNEKGKRKATEYKLLNVIK